VIGHEGCCITSTAVPTAVGLAIPRSGARVRFRAADPFAVVPAPVRWRDFIAAGDVRYGAPIEPE